MKEKSIYAGVLLFILAITLLLQQYKVDPFETFSLRFNDINFALQKKTPNENIVFVAVDEPSVKTYGRWPWSRDTIAKGVANLNQADVVLLDMIFSEPTTENEDNALVDAIEGLNSSVCGFFLRDSSTQDIKQDSFDLLMESSLDRLQSEIKEYLNPVFVSADFAEMNILPIMQACSLSGSFSTLPENDHLLRSYPIAVYFQDYLYPSLAVQGLRLKFDKDLHRIGATEVELHQKTIGLNSQGFIRLNYYDKELYNIISFLDVAEGRIDPSYFQGKIVILGITEVGAGDVVSTPIGSLYGPLLHYTFLSNYLENHLIKEPLYISQILIFMMVLLPFIFIFTIKKVFYRVVFYGMFYTAVYLVVRYLFVENMIYIDLFYPFLALILSAAVIEVIAFNIQEKGGRFLRDAFSSYLSADLLDELIKNPDALTLGGESKELSILFSDIRGFTTLSESMTPVELITLLNRYFTPMTNAVLNNNGMLDKYIGDAVMAFFNAPVSVKNHADASCRTALEMIEQLDILNSKLQSEGLSPIRIGIGINTAEVVVGNMGSDTRFNYTVIGDGVNLASRVEGLTKNYKVDILITEFTVVGLTEDFLYRMIEPVMVKGKDTAVILYQLMQRTKENEENKKLYDEALQVYKDGDLEKAKDMFENIVSTYKDTVSEYLLENIRQGQLWGVHRMTTK